MSSRVHSGKDSERITSDGTAARTRPLSIRDIMLRREKKSASEAKKSKEVLQDNDKDKSNHLEPGPETRKENKSRKDLKDMPRVGSKKANIKDTPGEGSKKDDLRDTPGEASKKDDLRHTPREGSKKENRRYTPSVLSKKENLKDRLKDSSMMDGLKDTPNVPWKDGKKDGPKKGSKQERSSTRDDSHLVDKDKNIHNSRKHSTSISGWGDESRSANPGEITARNGGTRTSESQKGPGKRWNDETVSNNRIKERREKLQNGAKRKHDAFDDEKGSQVGRPVFKKHDSAQFRDFKHSDRNDGRKEYAKIHHEEPRSKRRRSRSRDHDRERRERSVSLSPRDQRHSYRGHARDNYPPYHSMDKSSRRHADTDRHKTSGNDGYSGGPYRRNESRLGGYSPRKRKTSQRDEQATTKAASPVNRSPEKKSATWDQRPVGADQSNFFTALHPTVSQMDSSFPVNFTTSKQGPKTTLETILSGSSLAVDSVQLTQATRPLRRLHIENLPSSATEDLLIGCLNEFLLSSGVNHIERSKQPCLSCTINKEKCQAFVEFLTPEDATAALSFDGRSFNGSSLKIRRPKEYIEMAQIAPKKPIQEIKLVSDVVADSPHKIFIAGISGVISSEMLMEIVSVFGPLAAYRFLFNEDIDGACAFLEYIDHSITSKACAGLNGMKLGGCILTAVHVFPNPPEEAGNEASAFYGVPDNAKSLLAEPTKVLQLKNVFDQEEYLLLSKSELEETLEDVRMECARFGAVKSINAVEYPANRDNAAEDLVVEPKDGSSKIMPNECGGNDKFTETGMECSVLNQSRDVPVHFDTSETKDVDSIPESLDHKGLGALCDAPAATEEHTDQCVEANQMDGALCDAPAATEERTDQCVEANQMESVEAHHEAIAVDDGSLDKEDAEPGTLEIYSPTAPGDVADKTGRENRQQGDNEMSEGNAEKVPETDTRDGALVSNTSALEAGCILVEFTRKEAACIAAHSLHGRRFGNRIVSAGYAPHDLYLQKYPR